MSDPLPPRLRMEGIEKSFGPTRALRGVSFTVQPGEVHALVGENGAGKSTLMRILSGAETADAGSIWLDGEAYRPRGPMEARQQGVAMIYQELALAPHLDVESNIMLGIERHRFGFVRRREHRRLVQEALDLLEHPEISSEARVERLGPGARQLVEIARALLLDARVLVLDEPTSSLTRRDTEHLFALIARLKSRGVSIVYISHFLEEVQRIADRFTVLRDGESVASGSVKEVSLRALVELMVGRRLEDLYPRIAHELGEPILEVVELAGRRLPISASFTLRRGEILGIFGLLGAGRTELLRTIFGLDSAPAGIVRIKGRPLASRAPHRAIAHGFGLLSENRKDEGLALTQSITDNLTYSHLTPYLHGIWLRLSRRRRAVRQWLERLRVRCRGPEQPIAQLSGGNQQKVALGRLLHQHADILLLDEPTRGVDVGSKAEIYRLIGEQAAEGRAVVFVSSYLPELMGVCDSLAVMTRGRLSPARPIAEWTPQRVLALAAGGEES